MYVTRRIEHMKELESLLLRIAEPPGNHVRGGFSRSENWAGTLRRAVKDYDEARRRELLGKGTVASKERQRRALARAGGVARGAVPPGVVTRAVWLYGSRGGYEHWARLFESGEIQYGSRRFSTPTAAARAATGKSAIGWRFWKFKNDKGVWVPLRKLIRS